MFPIDLNHETTLTDWWFTIGCGIFLVALLAGVIGSILDKENDPPGELLFVGAFGGFIGGCFWPIILATGLGWGFLAGSRYLVHRPPRAIRLERAAAERAKERAKVIRALEEDLDLMPLVEVSPATVEALWKARQGTRGGDHED